MAFYFQSPSKVIKE